MSSPSIFQDRDRLGVGGAAVDVRSDASDTADAKAAQRSFTGDKLDWMTALSADPFMDARAFEVGFCIAQHVNAKNGIAILSDDTISDKTGIPKRWVLRVRLRIHISEQFV
jgi:hypothetical protein